MLCGQPVDPQPANVHADGEFGRGVPSFESPGALPGAEDAPHLPLPPQPGMRTDFSQQVQVFAGLQERGRLLLAGAAQREEGPLDVFLFLLSW